MSLLTFDPYEVLPSGLLKLKCSKCKQPMPGAKVNGNSELGKSILYQYAGYRCIRYIDHVILDEFNDLGISHTVFHKCNPSILDFQISASISIF